MPEHDWTEKQGQYLAFIYNYSVIHGHSSVGSNIVLSDVPERKGDLVEGCYELPALEGETTVAVKIIDMLGEEVLVVTNV
jgi:hypothetical protein